MSPKAVSMLDQTGALAHRRRPTAPAGRPRRAAAAVREPDRGAATPSASSSCSSRSSATTTCAPRVTADIDFSQTEATSEEFKPNQGSDASISIRSQQTTEQGGGAGGALAERRARRGLEPAADRRDRAAHRRVAAAAGRADRAAAPAGASGRREAVTNYEVDKTVRVTKSATGNVKRLNAAVVVNNRTRHRRQGQDDAGAAHERRDREAHARWCARSIGFNKERGDSVKVINAPFKVEPVANVETPFWKSPELIDLVRAAALPAGLGAGRDPGLLRPAAAGHEERVRRAPARLGRPRHAHRRGGRRRAAARRRRRSPRRPTSSQIEGAKALAKDNPAAVAGIVRGWVGGQAA